MNAVDQVQLNFNPATLAALNVLIGLIMFGVALDIRVDDFKRVVRDPRGPMIGLTAQFILLPAMTYVLVGIIDPLPSIGLGMMMVAACPGGKATTPPGQPKTTRNESGDTIIKVTKVSPADDDDGTVEKASKGWFCKLLFCSQERA